MRNMMKRAAVALVSAHLLAFTLGATQVAAQPLVASRSADFNRLQLTAGKTHAIDLPEDAKEVFVTDPAVVTATIRGSRKLLLLGKSNGAADIFIQDMAGKPISSYNVIVSRNIDELREIIRSVVPERKFTLTTIGRQVLLTGEANSIEEVERIDGLSRAFLGEGGGLVNQLTVRDADQVMIKVTVAEVQRSILRDLGIRTRGSWSVGRVTGVGDLGNNSLVSEVARLTMSGSDVMSISALERTGALRTLAEPTLTALSGQTATFTAGGEVPVSGGLTCPNNTTAGSSGCVATVTFKKVGIDLKFAPVVLSSGRIRLKVSTAIIEVDPSTFSNIGGTTTYGFRNREMETTVELPSGGSMMTAGLLQQQSSVQLQGTPGLNLIPVLGALFRSKEYQRRETELLIVVVPFIAKHVKPDSIALPTDAYVIANEANQILMGRISKQYGSSSAMGRTANQTGFVAQ